jgi:hypothetical protein
MRTPGSNNYCFQGLFTDMTRLAGMPENKGDFGVEASSGMGDIEPNSLLPGLGAHAGKTDWRGRTERLQLDPTRSNSVKRIATGAYPVKHVVLTNPHF